MKDDKKPDNTSLYLLGLFVFGIFGLNIWQKIRPSLLEWYFAHRLQVAFIVACFMTWFLTWSSKKYKSKKLAKEENKKVTGKSDDSVFAGTSDKGEAIHVKPSQRIMHAQIVGTTNAGKTESVIAPWAIDDIKKSRGFIMIDGKAETSLRDKLYAYAVEAGRSKDFRLFSLSDVERSHTYNPFIGGTVDEIVGRVFHSFGIEHAFYADLQFSILKNTLYIFREAKETVNFLKLWQAISDPAKLHALAVKGEDPMLIEWAQSFLNEDKDSRRENVTGLLTNLNHFVTGDTGKLFNTYFPTLSVEQAMQEGLIVYFQLPVLKMPNLGKAVARLVLQDIQSSVSNRHEQSAKKHEFFSVYLDDFTEYLTEPFVSLLNKSRSANVGVTFAHQAVGDLEKLGANVKNQILTNANLKVFMRTNEPESAEYFAKTIGTKETRKKTERETKTIFGHELTGEASVRDAEQFIYHPNLFKSGLGLGEAVMVLPHDKGSKHVKLKFQRCQDLKAVELPKVSKFEPDTLKVEVARKETNVDTGNTLHDASKVNQKTESRVA